MSYKSITKYNIFGNTSKKEILEKKCTFSDEITHISTKFDKHEQTDSNNDEKFIITEFMNNKIEDPEMAIETLKKSLEENLSTYNKKFI